MIKSFSKIAFVVVLLALLPTDAVNAQIQMTRMPTRLEEVLLDPNLGAILRRNALEKEASNAPAIMAGLPVASTTPPTSLLAPSTRPVPLAPTYSNERSRFSAIRPAVDNARSVASRLPTIEQTEAPPTLSLEPLELALGDEADVADVADEPTLVTNDAPPVPKALAIRDETPSQPELAKSDPNENTDMQEPLVPIKGQLRFRVTGVSAMIENQPADLTIEVFNPTSHPIGPVEVNVKVPVELTITRFDRDAWLDAERRIIAFAIDRVEPGAIQTIGMKGLSETPGHTVLDVALLTGETMVAQRTIKTQVFPEQLARRHNFGDTDQSGTIQQ